MALQVVQAPEPPWVRIARGELGVREVAGAPNERVNEYLASVGAPPGSDWCAGFVQWVMEQSGIKGPGKPVARAWLHWGQSISQPRAGCVVVLWRVTPSSWQGHVALLLTEAPKTLVLLGGNQSKAVSIKRYPRDRLLGFRWPE